jgi:hypothetical protein
MFHHEWMLLILMSKMYYSEYLKWGVIVTMLPSAESLGIVLHTPSSRIGDG